MAKTFKPRRGKHSTMVGTKKGTVLADGELFVEYPDAGKGKGAGKIYMGNGSTAYSSLVPIVDGNVSSNAVTITADSSSTASAALNNVTSGKTLGALVGSLKQAISKQQSTITSLSDEIPFKFGIDSSGNYGYYKAGADSVTPFLVDEKTVEGDHIFVAAWGGSGAYSKILDFGTKKSRTIKYLLCNNCVTNSHSDYYQSYLYGSYDNANWTELAGGKGGATCTGGTGTWNYRYYKLYLNTLNAYGVSGNAAGAIGIA